MTIWQALDLYRDEYAPNGSAWHSSPITVDKRTGRKVLYYLGRKTTVDLIKDKKLPDGSADIEWIMAQVDYLPLLFSMNYRNNVLDVYRSDGILEDMPYPYPIHVEMFTQAVAELLNYEEEVGIAPEYNGPTLDGTPVAAGRDSLGDNLTKATSGNLNMSEAQASKYTDELVRKTASKSFKASKTYLDRKHIDRDSVDLTKLVPDYILTKEKPKELDDTDEFTSILSEMAHIEAGNKAIQGINEKELLQKPRILGIVGLISSLLDKLGNK